MEYVTNDFGEAQDLPRELHAHRRRAVATPLILAFFFLLYVIMFIQARAWNLSLGSLALGTFRTDLLSRFGGLVMMTSSRDVEAWRLVTATFVHLNLLHLVINSYCIFSLGRAVENYFGTRRMFFSFIVCSVVANAFTVAWTPAPAIRAGTLGGLFGLDGMLLGFALRNRSALPPRAFHWMLASALSWPVFWIILAYSVLGGGVEGLIAGFGAGAVMGLILDAAVFKQRAKPSGIVSFLFVTALAACTVSWVLLLSSSASAREGHEGLPGAVELELDQHYCEEGGFEIPVPPDMEVTLADGRLDIGIRGWVFCRAAWRDAGTYDEPESLAKAAISDRSLEGTRDGDVRDVHLVEHERLRIDGKDAVFFVLSMLMKGDELLYAQAILKNDEKVYTMTFYYPAEDRLRGEQVYAIRDGFRFVEAPGQR